MFGELRSILHSSRTIYEKWDIIVKDLLDEFSEDELEEQVLPYLDVHLSECRQIESLYPLKNLIVAQSLYLYDKNIGDEGVRVLASSPHLRRLRGLYLSWNAISDEGAIALANSPYYPEKITEMSLMGNSIRDEGAIALASSPWLSNLRVLALMNNRIGDAGAMALASSPYVSNLQLLYLDGNLVSDVGRRALLASPHLRNCELVNWRK